MKSLSVLSQLGGDPGVDPKLSGEIIFNSSGLRTPRDPKGETGRCCWGIRHLKYPV